MNAYMRQQMLDRLKPTMPNYTLARAAVDRCIELGEEAQRRRLDVRLDATISAAERKSRLDEIETGALARGMDDALEPLKPLRQQVEHARAGLRWGGNLSKTDQGVSDVVTLVDAVAFMARRDLEGKL